MPLQNRVLPSGEIVALPVRGTFTGNRGILHGPDRVLGAARWRVKAWICCTLDWKGVRRPVMTGRTWTELFFLDEAVALAAGHRPCASCRRAAFAAFQRAWAEATGRVAKAPEMDAALHRARVAPRSRRQVTHHAAWADLPDGAFVQWNGTPHLVRGGALLRFAPDGYGAAVARPTRGEALVMTPLPTIAVLQAGFAPVLHPSAASAG